MSMPVAPGVADRVALAAESRCWGRIGAYGDRSCVELAEYVHCRNCPAYSVGARALLDRELDAARIAEWTEHVARLQPVVEPDTRSIVIFRLGSEWLAVPTPTVAEVGAARSVHSLPGRRDGVVAGLANVRGQLLICVSLERLLSLAGADRSDGHVPRRLLVLRHALLRVVCHVDEVHGVHHCESRSLTAVPDTIATPAGAFSRTLLPWQNRSVGLLDVDRLFDALRTNLA